MNASVISPPAKSKPGAQLPSVDSPLESEDLSASNFEDFPAVVAAEPAALLAGTQRAASSAAQSAAQ